MIDARDLSYKLLDLWRERAMINNDAAAIVKGQAVQPVFVKTKDVTLIVTNAELTEQGIVLHSVHTGDSR